MLKKFLLPIILLLLLTGCGKESNVQLDSPESVATSSIQPNDITKLTSSISDLDYQKDNIALFIDGHALSFSYPVYLDKSRYYIPLNEIIKNLGGTLIKNKDNTLTMTLYENSYTFNLEDSTVNSTIKLKKNLINNGDLYYIGLSDLSNILNMYTRWDKDSKTIYCKTNDTTFENTEKYMPKINQIGLIRLEDIVLSNQEYDKEFLEKLRIMGNFLNSKNVPYHIAWIPRYVCPSMNIDVDPMKQNDFSTAELVYTLDYLTNNSALIGLHGYTHQNGSEESAVGTEFGANVPSTENFKTKIEKALATAEYLDIPIDFFETPHYQITPEQNKIAEEYFNILYYPFQDFGLNNVDLTKPQLSPYNKSSYYISTALDYIPENNIDGAINNLYNADTNNMGSIFFHPRLDFSFIELGEENSIPTYKYIENSPLQQVISALQEKGFNMSKVTDIEK